MKVAQRMPRPGFAGKIAAVSVAVVRYARGVLGEDAYEKYLAYHRASGCAAPPLSEREFWRDRTDRQEANPEGRCC